MTGDAHGLGPDFSVLNMTLADVEQQLGATGQQLGSMNVVGAAAAAATLHKAVAPAAAPCPSHPTVLS